MITKKDIKCFRILKDWKITISKSKKIGGQVNMNMNKKTAIIYQWNCGKEPKEYKLHELLHIALIALALMDKRKFKKLFDAHEELIQDICEFKNK